MTLLTSPDLTPLDTSPKTSLRIAIIGDVHGHWTEFDSLALHHLQADLVLFVGDLGNEDVELVRTIASLDLPKAIILGNHDAWYTMTAWGRKQCPYDRSQDDRVQAQLEILGNCHVGYGRLDLPQFGLTVVGSRPFSWGGPKWRDKTFYRERYGINSFAASVERIVAMAQTSLLETVVMIGHCGPLGLGDRPEDPCGKDWHPVGGDYGDPDFAGAIARIQSKGQRIPLVAFGHMHHRLRPESRSPRACCPTASLERTAVKIQAETVYVNAAQVPRIITTPRGFHHYFCLVDLNHHQVTQVQQIWLDHTLLQVTQKLGADMGLRLG